MTRHLLPSAGSLGWLSLLQRYYEVLRLPAARSASLRFALLRGTAADATETSGSPRFLGDPCAHALLSDPGGTGAP